MKTSPLKNKLIACRLLWGLGLCFWFIDLQGQTTENSWKINLPDSSIYLSGGNLGVNHEQPNAKMVIHGVVKSKGLEATPSSWPDYVFQEDYKMPNLLEWEKYIKKYGHLPGFLPAKTMTAKPADLAETTIKMLETIEVLTLLLLDQETRLMELNKQMVKDKN